MDARLLRLARKHIFPSRPHPIHRVQGVTGYLHEHQKILQSLKCPVVMRGRLWIQTRARYRKIHFAEDRCTERQDVRPDMRRPVALRMHRQHLEVRLHTRCGCLGEKGSVTRYTGRCSYMSRYKLQREIVPMVCYTASPNDSVIAPIIPQDRRVNLSKDETGVPELWCSRPAPQSSQARTLLSSIALLSSPRRARYAAPESAQTW